MHIPQITRHMSNVNIGMPVYLLSYSIPFLGKYDSFCVHQKLICLTGARRRASKRFIILLGLFSTVPIWLSLCWFYNGPDVFTTGSARAVYEQRFLNPYPATPDHPLKVKIRHNEHHPPSASCAWGRFHTVRPN